MEIPLLSDIVIILGLAVLVILIFHRFNLPNILGFLLTGIVAGPYGLSLINAMHEVEVLAEIGIILLLFIIGLEFSITSLEKIKRAVFIGGFGQVVGTIFIIFFIAYFLGFELQKAVFLGFLFSLSSTAIVLKMLQEKGEINSPHGKVTLAILIFQDIIVVPLMLFTPLLAGVSENIWLSLLILLGKGSLVITLVLVSARYIVPKLLFQVALTKSRELFILSIVVICFAVAWLTSAIGLSLALGAFMAGLIISESEYSHQATSNILPFREVFTSFFFVSIGMMLDVNFLVENVGTILLYTLITLVLKGLIAGGVTGFLQYPGRTAIMVGLSLFQVGEFAFILSKTGIEYGLLSEEVNQYFLAVSIVTMGITPFIINKLNAITERFIFIGNTRVFKPARVAGNFLANSSADNLGHTYDSFEHHEQLSDHILIIGFGLNGRNVAKAAQLSNIPYVILEVNAQTVKKEKENGEPIIYGDATTSTILHHVKVEKARVVVIAISDPYATKKIISCIRSLSKKPYVIVRTRFVMEVEENLNLGANEVIPEEFETSIEIFTRVLAKYLVPQNKIEKFIMNVRAGNYEMFRSLSLKTDEEYQENLKILEENDLGAKFSVDLPGIEIAALQLTSVNKELFGKTLAELGLKNKFGISIVAIQRSETIITDITGETQIQNGDLIYVLGTPENILNFNNTLEVDFEG